MTEKDIENLNQAFNDMFESGLTAMQKKQLHIIASLVNTHVNNLSEKLNELNGVKDELELFQLAIMDVDSPIQ